MGTKGTFVHFLIALTSVSIESLFAFALESGVLVAIFSLLGLTDRIGVTFVGSV